MSIRKLERTTLRQIKLEVPKLELSVLFVIILLYILKRNIKKHQSPILGMASHTSQLKHIRLDMSANLCEPKDYISKFLVPNENHFLRKRNSSNVLVSNEIDPRNAV